MKEKRSQNHVKWASFDRQKRVKVVPDRAIHLDQIENELAPSGSSHCSIGGVLQLCAK